MHAGGVLRKAPATATATCLQYASQAGKEKLRSCRRSVTGSDTGHCRLSATRSLPSDAKRSSPFGGGREPRLRGRQELEEGVLIEHGDLQFLGFLELRTRIGAGDDEVRLLRDAGADGSTEGL